MNLYISDLHFGHENAIEFDHRPFADVDEMDRRMIELSRLMMMCILWGIFVLY